MTLTMDDHLGLKGPGMLWVNSKINKPHLLDWPTFIKWYDEDVIPKVNDMSGITTVIRASARDHTEERPNLCIVATDDMAFFDSEEYRSLSLHSEMLPDTGKYFDLADFDCRWYSLLSVFDHKKTPLAETKCFLVTTWDLRGDLTEEQLDDWYLNIHNGQMAVADGFLRSTRFKLEHDWWSAGDGASLPCPDWIEICEFDSLTVDLNTILEQNETEIQRKILSQIKFEVAFYSPEKFVGTGNFFHGM